MLIFVGTARHRQPVLLVLYVAPEHIVKRAQRFQLEMSNRIATSISARAFVLKAHAYCVYRLDQHPLFMPIGPVQLDPAGIETAKGTHVTERRSRGLRFVNESSGNGVDIGQRAVGPQV